MDRHHVGEIAGRHVDAPLVEIEDPHSVGDAGARQHEIPGVSIAMGDAEMTA